MTENIEQLYPMPENMPQNVVLFGGGTGLSTVLSALRPYIGRDGMEVTAVVTTFDDGGSTGDLRKEYPDLMAVGDVRQCIVALSNASEKVKESMGLRLGAGNNTDKLRLKGQAPGNILLAALYQDHKREHPDSNDHLTEALQIFGEMLEIEGRVLPVTEDNRRLIFNLPDGTVINGEHAVDKTTIPSLRGAEIRFDQEPTIATQAVINAILKADLIVLAPGDPYTSIGPVLAVEKIREALVRTKAVRFMIANLMNRPSQTKGFTALTFAQEYERILGSPFIDRVIYNTGQLPPDLLAKQLADGSRPVEPDVDGLLAAGYEPRGFNLILNEEVTYGANDELAQLGLRQGLRHNPHILAFAICETRYRNGFGHHEEA